MKQFNDIIEKSKVIARFAQVERLSTDELYELYFDCFCAYRNIFSERMHFSRRLRQVISAYRDIPAFMSAGVTQVQRIIFNSQVMHRWFALRFWLAIERQVTTGQIDKTELINELAYMNIIPSRATMEEILNGRKNGYINDGGSYQSSEITAEAAGRAHSEAH